MGPIGRRRTSRARVVAAALTLAAVLALPSIQSPAAAGTAPPRNIVTTPAAPLLFGFEASSIARDPVRQGHIAIAFQEWTKGLSCYLSLSEDGGRTWSYHALTGDDGEVAGARQFTQTVHRGGFEDNRAACEAPQLTFGPDGTLYYLIETVGEFGSLYLLVSHDGGHSFADPVAIDAAPVNGNGDRSDGHSASIGGIAVDQATGRVYVDWMHGTSQSYFPEFRIPGDEVDAAYSTDGGRTFSKPVRLSPFPPQTYFSDKRIAVGPDGRVYAVWGDLTSLDGVVVWAAVSSDHGLTYSSPTLLGQLGFHPACAPTSFCPGLSFDFLVTGHLSVAAGPSGQAYVTWWDQQLVGDLNRVMVVSTGDGGASWSLPSPVGVPAGASSHHQWDSVVSVTRTGRVAVVFYDLAPDYTQDVYLATSSDRAATFSPPQKLTDLTTDARGGPTFGGVAPHPQPGFVASESGISVAWTDPRRNLSGGGHQDVYFASTDPADGSNSSGPFPLPTGPALGGPSAPATPPTVTIASPHDGGAVTSPTPAKRSWQVPWLSVDRAEPSHMAIAFQEGQTHDACYMALTDDAGFSWRSLAVVGKAAPHPVPGSSSCAHPEVEFTPAGGLAYSFESGGGGGHVYVTVAAGPDKPFSTPVRVDTPRPQDVTGISSYQANLAVDPTTGSGPPRIYVAYYTFEVGDFSSPRVSVATSNDGGRTFGTPVAASLPGIVPRQLMAPVVDAAGVVYVAYLHDFGDTFAGAPLDLEVISSKDHGATFTPPVSVALISPCLASTCPDRYPTVTAAAGPAAGHLFVAWATPPSISSCGLPQTCAPSPSRISISATSDGGSTWSPPKDLGVHPRNDADDLILPAVRVAPHGRVDVAYYERTPGGAADGPGIQDTYLASSSDGAATFGTARRVSDVSSSTAVAPGGSGTSFGDSIYDYIGLAALSGGAAVTWTDSRRGTTADLHQDVYIVNTGAPSGGSSAVLSNPESSLPGTPNTNASARSGAPLAAAVALGLMLGYRRRRGREGDLG